MTETTKTTKSPLVTFALFAYNQEKYIREAVEGAFAQTYEPLEIILSDDCSTDRTFEIMQEMEFKYHGPHKVILNKNEKNIGLIPHINKVIMQISTGELIVMAAGDDISLPCRVDHVCKNINKENNIFSVSMNFHYIDDNGVFIKREHFYKESILCLHDFLHGAKIPKLGFSRAYKREVFENFGPLLDKTRVEDISLSFRSILLGKTCHTNEVGVLYRDVSSSLSKKVNLNYTKKTILQMRDDLKISLKSKMINYSEFLNADRILYNKLTIASFRPTFERHNYKINILYKVMKNPKLDISVKIFIFKMFILKKGNLLKILWR